MLHERQTVFLLSKCVEFFSIIFTNTALRADEFVDIKLSVKVTVNFSSNTTFCMMASGLLICWCITAVK